MRQGLLVMSNILIVYHYYGQYPPRATKWDHLFCFEKYTEHTCWYLNLAFWGIPWFLPRLPFDLVIFHTLFFSLRWKRRAFTRYVCKARPLKQLEAVKIALPQDEFVNTDLVGDFLNEFRITDVFSVAPASEWPKIYPTVDRRRVKFHQVLTGYLDDATVARVNRLAASIPTRSVDIGYRTGPPDPTLGRHGYRKGEVAAVFQTRVAPTSLVVDISSRPQDLLLGDEWYKFLLRCKYTLGAESGSSILDSDGTLRQRVLAYVAAHPQAPLAEIAAACCPYHEGSLGLAVIAPRHLEACATRTCQVLIEGAYNGILVPGQHYIALKPDYSNIDQVVRIIQDDQLRQQMIEQAYCDVVASGCYSYRSFVHFVIHTALAPTGLAMCARPLGVWERMAYGWLRLTEALAWRCLAWLAASHRIMVKILPPRTIHWIKSLLVKWFL
jgi:hypothetical protein